MADRPQTNKEKMGMKLDEALKDSFSSSDLSAISASTICLQSL